MSTDLQTSRTKQTPMVLGNRGVELATMEDLWRFATCIANSGMAPKGMEKPEALVIAIEMGLEVGMRPMQSIQNIAVINGRPAVWGDAMLALCKNVEVFDHAAFKEELVGEGEKMVAKCTVRRLPAGQVEAVTYSVEDAKTAGLWKKAGPWTQYPKRMLQLRARAFALRNAFPDVLRGLYMAEELLNHDRPAVQKSKLESLMDERIENVIDVPVQAEPAAIESEPAPELPRVIPSDPPEATAANPDEDADTAAWIEELQSVGEVRAVNAAITTIPASAGKEAVKKMREAAKARIKEIEAQNP